MSLLRMFLMLAIMVAVAFTYGVKDEVLAIQKDIRVLKAQIKEEEQLIADYEAEWAAKSAVPHLMQLGNKFLPNTTPLTAKHFVHPNDIPLRAKSSTAVAPADTPLPDEKAGKAVSEIAKSENNLGVALDNDIAAAQAATADSLTQEVAQ